MMTSHLANFTDVLGDADEIENSQPISLPSSTESVCRRTSDVLQTSAARPAKRTGQHGDFRSVEEIDPKYRGVFTYPFFNLVQSSVIEDALYSDKSMVVCAPTGSGKTVVFEMAIVQLLMEIEDKNYTGDFKIIYMAPVKALCTERLTEWYSKFTRLGLLCIEVTGDTDVDFTQLKPYRVIITTPEKWDMLTRRWRDHRGLVEVVKLFLIDEVHILNDETRGPVLEAVVSRMKTIESSAQSAHRIEKLQKQYQDSEGDQNFPESVSPRIRFVAVSATVSNPEDVAAWLGTSDKPAVYYKFGDECRPVKLKRVVEGYPCPSGMSIFKFDIILNYKLWPIIQKYHDGKPTLIFCNTRKSVALTAETLSKELTISFTTEQKAKLTALASTIKNKKLQALVLSGVGCHHAGLLYEERLNIERAFRNRDLPILITTTTLAMGVNLPAHLVIVKNTQQYVNGGYQEYSISTVLQMVGRAGRPQFDVEATAVIMTRLIDKPRYQALVGGSEPLQSSLHKRLAENLNSEAALGTVGDVAQCVQWLRSTFLCVRAAKDPRRYLGLPPAAPSNQISKKIEELCVKAMNGLASSGLITMDEASCIESTEAGRLMSIYYLDLETMKLIMKIEGTETLEKLLWVVCESHELSDMHLRVDERRCLNALNRNNTAATIRFPMKGKISTRQMKVNCIIQAILGCLPIPDPSLNQEAMKVMRIADRICKCLVAYVTRPDLISQQPPFFAAVLNSITLAKCIAAHLWENSASVSKQLKGIGPTFSTLLATAGKVNFMLLEESHPRDLERIMNKGPPAGNVIRKQISLLPKYQLTTIPIDENKVSIQLTLLNQAYLSENIDNLSAGDCHKCYIVIGDSENHLLLLTSFRDKDLIGVYDGTITYQISRKHNFEHKILVHCISSNFVGIDAHCEYLFNDLGPTFSRGDAGIGNQEVKMTEKKSVKKQTCITDTFKERKRKNQDANIAQSKEKIKRESALLEKFKNLKDSFAYTSKEIKEANKSTKMSNEILQEMVQPDTSTSSINTEATVVDNRYFKHITTPMETNISNTSQDNYPEINFDGIDDDDDFIAAEHVDSILNEIESEISKSRTKNNNISPISISRKLANERRTETNCIKKPIYTVNQTDDVFLKENSKITQKRKSKNSRSNYSFIELLEKNADLSDDEETIPEKDSTFSDTIRNQLEHFLHKTQTNTKQTDQLMQKLLNNTNNTNELILQAEQENIEPMELDQTSLCPTDIPIDPKEVIENKLTEFPIVFADNAIDNYELNACTIQHSFDKNMMEDLKNKEICNTNTYLAAESKVILNNSDEREHLDNQNYSSNDYDSKLNLNEIKHPLVQDLTDSVIDLNRTDLSTCLVDKNLIRGLEYAESLVELKDDIQMKSEDSNANINILHKELGVYIPLIDQTKTVLERRSNQSYTQNQNVINDNFKTCHVKNTSLITDLISSNEESESSRNTVFKLLQTPRHYNSPVGLSSIIAKHEAPHISERSQITQYISGNNSNAQYAQKDQYVNKYKLTASKVDVCTKTTPEHEIKVVRKLTLDLDITEVITKAKYDVHCDDRNKEDILNRNIYLATKEPQSIKNHKHNGETNEENKLLTTDTSNIDKLNKTYKEENQQTYVMIENDVDFGNEDNISKRNNLVSNSTKLEMVSIQNSDNINLDCAETKTRQLTLDDNNSVNENSNVPTNNVESILQKYSNIFRNNSSTPQHKTEVKPYNSIINSTLKQSKRPYKITDIDSIDIALPKTLAVEVSRSQRPTKEVVLPKLQEINQNIETIKDDPNIVFTEKMPEHDDESFKIPNQYPEYHSPSPEIPQIEQSTDFTIDQSMFNPQTLLQCMSNDESNEIIPPPLEFCDKASVYSPTQYEDPPSVRNDLYTQESLSERQYDIEDIRSDVTSGSEHDRSIIEDNSYKILTPSTEIETWTLSREDKETEKKCYTPINSVTATVMRNLPIKSLASKRTKLQKFKFPCKDVLKM